MADELIASLSSLHIELFERLVTAVSKGYVEFSTKVQIDALEDGLLIINDQDAFVHG